MKILSAAQIREWDAFTILNEPISSLLLMERAALKCTEWISLHYKGAQTIKIFCGKGNNGGDGLAIARLLSERAFNVHVFILEAGGVAKPDFAANLTKLNELALPVSYIRNEADFPALVVGDLIIDALYGTGVSRPLSGLSALLVEHINNSTPSVIAIDLPSGLNADKTSVTNTVIEATYTLTFQVLKLALLVPENEQFAGKVEILDIQLHAAFLQQIESKYQLVSAAKVKEIYRPRKQFSHKGTYGHALVIAGEKGKMGAGILASKACLRSGVGLLTTAIPASEMQIMQTASVEGMAIEHEALVDLEWGRFAAIGIGPGLGTTNKSEQLLHTLLSGYFSPCVFDADALNILAANPGWQKELPPNSIITPHPKEFERLFGSTKNDFERIKLALKQSRALHINIVLKGNKTLIALPNGKAYFNNTGNPGMATGGSGDVLTGILTGLLAQGYEPADATILGVYLHGLSGDIAAAHLSEEALIAGDLIDNLGKAFLTLKQ